MPEQEAKRDIRIKEPSAPASDAQLSLIADLYDSGVVTPEELAALGDTPTKQAAGDLLGAHSDEDAFKAVQEARRAARASERAASRATSGGPRSAGDGRGGFAHVKVPAAFLHPYTYTARDGREFEKAYVDFPKGTKVNGIDLSGYSCDVFLTDRMKQQMLSGEQPSLSFKADEKVAVWTGRKDDPEHPYKRFEVEPWALARGVKGAMDEFKAGKAAERATRSAGEHGTSLADMERQTRTSAEALSGHGAQDDRLPETR